MIGNHASAPPLADRQAPRERARELVVGALGAGDQLRVRSSPRARARARCIQRRAAGSPVARFLNARASADRGIAKFGALQPSVPVRRSASSILAGVGDRALDRSLDGRIGIEVALGRNAERPREREESGVLPEQLWRSGSRSSPPDGWRPRMRMPIGQCAPQPSVRRRAPAFASRRAAMSCWRSPPSCERRRARVLRRRSPSVSHAPVRHSGSACNGLIAERVNVISSASPSAWVTRPPPSTTAAAAPCHASIPSPRVTTAAARNGRRGSLQRFLRPRRTPTTAPSRRDPWKGPADTPCP